MVVYIGHYSNPKHDPQVKAAYSARWHHNSCNSVPHGPYVPLTYRYYIDSVN